MKIFRTTINSTYEQDGKHCKFCGQIKNFEPNEKHNYDISG